MAEHKKRKHALLSASGASRWMSCTPSARAEEEFPEQGSSVFAEEGTLAHELSDVELNRFMGHLKKKPYEDQKRKIQDHELYSEEMPEEVAKYTDYVQEQFIDAQRRSNGAELLIEQRVDLTEWIENGFGTNDAIVLCDGVMEVIDLKYGKGVKVSAVDNPQLKLYGLGALHFNMLSYDIRTVRLTIVQPRLNNISTWEISAEELLAWGEGEVKPLAEKAYAGEGEFVPGDHCRWCRAKPRCKALAEYNQQLAKHDFEDPDFMTDEELVEAYNAIGSIQDWLKSVSGYMLNQALEGRSFPGMKVVAGRSMRRWVDEDKVIQALRSKRFALKDITNTKVKGIGDIEKLVGKANFEDVVGPYVIKPEGKPTLVPDSDKRPAMNDAVSDFTD